MRVEPESKTVFVDRASEKNTLFFLERTVTLEVAARADVTYFYDHSFSLYQPTTLLKIIVHSNAIFRLFLKSTGGMRQDLKISLFLRGHNAQATITGTVQTTAQESHSLFVEQIHEGADTISTVVVKGVARQSSKIAYKGMITLHPGSLRARAHQEHKVLLIGESAQATSVPSLQVLHDDVQCGHATTITQVDPEHLLQLALRGIQETAATALIIEGFLGSNNAP